VEVTDNVTTLDTAVTDNEEVVSSLLDTELKGTKDSVAVSLILETSLVDVTDVTAINSLLNTLVASAVNNEEVSLALVNALSVTDCADSSFDTTLVDGTEIILLFDIVLVDVTEDTIVEVTDNEDICLLLDVTLIDVTDGVIFCSLLDASLVEVKDSEVTSMVVTTLVDVTDGTGDSSLFNIPIDVNDDIEGSLLLVVALVEVRDNEELLDASLVEVNDNEVTSLLVTTLVDVTEGAEVGILLDVATLVDVTDGTGDSSLFNVPIDVNDDTEGSLPLVATLIEGTGNEKVSPLLDTKLVGIKEGEEVCIVLNTALVDVANGAAVNSPLVDAMLVEVVDNEEITLILDVTLLNVIDNSEVSLLVGMKDNELAVVASLVDVADGADVISLCNGTLIYKVLAELTGEEVNSESLFDTILQLVDVKEGEDVDKLLDATPDIGMTEVTDCAEISSLLCNMFVNVAVEVSLLLDVVLEVTESCNVVEIDLLLNTTLVDVTNCVEVKLLLDIVIVGVVTSLNDSVKSSENELPED